MIDKLRKKIGIKTTEEKNFDKINKILGSSKNMSKNQQVVLRNDKNIETAKNYVPSIGEKMGLAAKQALGKTKDLIHSTSQKTKSLAKNLTREIKEDPMKGVVLGTNLVGAGLCFGKAIKEYKRRTKNFSELANSIQETKESAKDSNLDIKARSVISYQINTHKADFRKENNSQEINELADMVCNRFDIQDRDEVIKYITNAVDAINHGGIGAAMAIKQENNMKQKFFSSKEEVVNSIKAFSNKD